MSMITSTKSVVGVSPGQVTCWNRCQLLAPSIAAASCRDRSIPWSPARKITMLYPAHFHTPTKIRAGIAQEMLFTQSGPGTWNTRRMA